MADTAATASALPPANLKPTRNYSRPALPCDSTEISRLNLDAAAAATAIAPPTLAVTPPKLRRRIGSDNTDLRDLRISERDRESVYPDEPSTTPSATETPGPGRFHPKATPWDDVTACSSRQGYPLERENEHVPHVPSPPIDIPYKANEGHGYVNGAREWPLEHEDRHTLRRRSSLTKWIRRHVHYGHGGDPEMHGYGGVESDCCEEAQVVED